MNFKIRLIALLFSFLYGFISIAQNVDFFKNIEKKISESKFQEALTDINKHLKTIEPQVNEYQKKVTVHQNATVKTKFIYRSDLAIPFYWRGLAQKGLGKTEDALKDFTTAYTFNPNYPEALYELALNKLKNNQKGDACVELKHVIEMGYKKAQDDYDNNFCWDMAKSIVQEATTKYNLRKYEEAIALYTTASHLSFDAELFFKRGMCHAGLNNTDTAIADITKAIAVDSTNDNYYYQRGMIYFNKADHQNAMNDFSDVLKLKPSAKAYIQRALCEEALNQQNAAIFDYNQAIRMEPDNGLTYYKRGLLKETSLNDRKSACEDYFKAVELGCEEANEAIKTCKKHKK